MAVAGCKKPKKRNVFVEGVGGGGVEPICEMALEYSLLTTSKLQEGARTGKKGREEDGKILNQNKKKTCE